MIIISVSCIGVIAVIEIIHYLERKDLYNRIMCRDIGEYRNKNPAKKPMSAHERVLKRWKAKERGGN